MDARHQSFCTTKCELFLKNVCWRIVDLKRVCFRCRAKWISYSFTLFFLQILFPYRPLESMEQSFLCYTTGSYLVNQLIYSSMYMSVPIFQFILPRPCLIPINYKFVTGLAHNKYYVRVGNWQFIEDMEYSLRVNFTQIKKYNLRAQEIFGWNAECDKII